MKTETENAGRVRRWLIIIALVVIAIVAAFFADHAVAAWMAAHSPVSLRRFMEVVSRVGDWPAHVVLGVILVTIAWFSGSKRWARIFVAMLIACALAGVVARAGKIAIGRPRPSVYSEQTWNGPSLRAKFNAFPSGHTASSTAFFVTILFAAGWRIATPFLLIPLLIALSRMIVAAHYLSDVVGGLAVGTITALLVADWMRIREAEVSRLG